MTRDAPSPLPASQDAIATRADDAARGTHHDNAPPAVAALLRPYDVNATGRVTFAQLRSAVRGVGVHLSAAEAERFARACATAEAPGPGGDARARGHDVGAPGACGTVAVAGVQAALDDAAAHARDDGGARHDGHDALSLIHI